MPVPSTSSLLNLERGRRGPLVHVESDARERSTELVARKPKLGTGKRFAALKGKLAKKGARSPGALAAYIGRKKYGAKKFAQLSAAGRKRKR